MSSRSAPGRGSTPGLLNEDLLRELAPHLPQPHAWLGELYESTDRFEMAAQEYAAVIAIEPRNRFARLMEAMALIRLKDYSEARSRLERGLSALPDDSDLALTLARLLAACPDSSIRDGRRALGHSCPGRGARPGRAD